MLGLKTFQGRLTKYLSFCQKKKIFLNFKKTLKRKKLLRETLKLLEKQSTE